MNNTKHFNKVGEQATIAEVGSPRKAKDGRLFFVAVFSFGLGITPVKRTIWQQSKIKADGGIEMSWERGSHTDFTEAMKNKDKVPCSKYTANVSPYYIGEGTNRRKVTTFSTVIFPDENPLTIFTANQKEVIDEDGVVLNQIKARVSQEDISGIEVQKIKISGEVARDFDFEE